MYHVILCCFFAKKQNRTLGIVKYTIFLIYEEVFNRRVFYSWNNTVRVDYVLPFSATSLGIKSCQVFVWSICNLTKMCATFYCLPYYDPSHLGWASRIIYAVHMQYNIHVHYKYTILHMDIVFRNYIMFLNTNIISMFLNIIINHINL